MSDYLSIRAIFLYIIVVQLIFTTFRAVKVFKKFKNKPKNKDYKDFLKFYALLCLISIGYCVFFVFVDVTGYRLLTGFGVCVANWTLKDYVDVLAVEPKTKYK